MRNSETNSKFAIHPQNPTTVDFENAGLQLHSKKLAVDAKAFLLRATFWLQKLIFSSVADSRHIFFHQSFKHYS